MRTVHRAAIAATALALVLAGALGGLLLADRDEGDTPRSAQAQEVAEDRGINVDGEGQVAVQPDTARLMVGVELEGEDLDEIRNEANSRMGHVFDALQEDLDIPERDIRTATYNIDIVEENDDDPRPLDDEDTVPEPNYQIVQIAQVRISDIDLTGEAIDAALDSGANNIGRISFEVEDREGAIEQARALAVENARSQAEQLAGLAGVTLGQPIEIDERSPSAPAVEMEEAAVDDAVDDVPAQARIEPGESVVEVNVSITYGIE